MANDAQGPPKSYILFPHPPFNDDNRVEDMGKTVLPIASIILIITIIILIIIIIIIESRGGILAKSDVSKPRT